MGLIGPNELVAQIHPRMPVILPLATSRCVVRRNGRWRPKSVVAPLPCRPDANVGNFPTGKQPKEMMIHRSGNPFIQSQHRQQPMRLNSCGSRHTLVSEIALCLGCLLSWLRVIRHPRDIDYHDRFVAHDPCIMPRRQQRYFTWTKLILTPIVHTDSETAGDMVLQVRSLAAFGIYNWFYAGRPFPPRLQCGTSERNSA